MTGEQNEQRAMGGTASPPPATLSSSRRGGDGPIAASESNEEHGRAAQNRGRLCRPRRELERPHSCTSANRGRGTGDVTGGFKALASRQSILINAAKSVFVWIQPDGNGPNQNQIC